MAMELKAGIMSLIAGKQASSILLAKEITWLCISSEIIFPKSTMTAESPKGKIVYDMSGWSCLKIEN